MLKRLYLIGLLFLVAGCSGAPQADYGKLGLVEISGVVTLDGTPVEDAGVFFYAPDETYSFGVTDASGNYTLMLNSDKSGIMPGEKRVEIWTTRNPLGEAVDSEGSGQGEEVDPDAKPQGDAEKIPTCYNQRSQLSLEVTGSDSGVDFELKSDCSTNSAS